MEMKVFQRPVEFTTLSGRRVYYLEGKVQPFILSFSLTQKKINNNQLSQVLK